MLNESKYIKHRVNHGRLVATTIMVCCPEDVRVEDVAKCIFRNNPKDFGTDEIPGIWRSASPEPAFAFALDTSPDPNCGSGDDSDNAADN
jgi:hypothetical protein